MQDIIGNINICTNISDEGPILVCTEQKYEKNQQENILNEKSAPPIPPPRQKRKIHKEDSTKSPSNVKSGTHNQNDKKQVSEDKTDDKYETDCQEVQSSEKAAGPDLMFGIKLVLQTHS